jgi:HEAT repeat protein
MKNSPNNYSRQSKKSGVSMSVVSARILLLLSCAIIAFAQTDDRLTPVQREIERQRQRLSSSEIEERRDALMKLEAMRRPEASRAAMAGLNDAAPMVRVAAAHAIVSLPADEAESILAPLLQDKLEFVRRETAYALGQTRSRAAVGPLANLLSSDKEASVRAAAAVALGQIRDEIAVPALSQVLSPAAPSSKKKKSKPKEDDFVIRAAAESLGRIGSRAGVNPLIGVLTDESSATEVKRVAAASLGLIGDPSARPALQAALASEDPYLSSAAREALRRIRAARSP